MTDSPTTTVFTGGIVFTADPVRPWATTVAVRGDRIIAVGGAETAAEFRRPGAAGVESVDLAGRFVAPGFVDAHVHPVMGGKERSRCDLSELEDRGAYRAAIAEYCTRFPERTWVLGAGWAMSAFPDGRPTVEDLDDVVPDRPVYLPNRDHHSAWVNTRALQLASIDERTPDPVDGRIERDAAGRPTGLLHEGAMDLVAVLAPADTQEDFDAGLLVGQEYLHSMGITGWQDALLPVHHQGPSEHRAYLRAQERGLLTARVAGALWWDRACSADGIDAQVANLVAVRDDVAALGGRYRTGHVKVMQDGVAETYTAALLSPYLDRCGHATDNSGLSFLEPAVLQAATAALDAAGFDVHFHALGDRAVREVLEALEQVRAVNGPADRRHTLAHLQLVAAADVPRFRRVGAVANLQPLWACHEEQVDQLTDPFLGAERALRQYPFGELFRDGAALAMGSDWPVSTPDPLAGLQVAVTRVLPGAPEGSPALGVAQELPLAVALSAYTAGSAGVCRFDDSGVLRPGAHADMVLMDRDPFEVSPAGTHVTATWVGGELVHGRV